MLQKDVAQFNDTLRAAMGSTAVFIAPPSYELNPIRISEIQPGVQVMVMVGGDGTAVQVTVLKSSGPQR